MAILAGSAAHSATTAIGAGSTWRYQKGTEEVSSPRSLWRNAGFNDTAWPSGSAPFHYGDGLPNGTELQDMRNNYTSVFLRHRFEVTGLDEVDAVRLLADYDDGFVAWINGREIARVGADSDPEHTDVSSVSHEGGDPVAFTPAGPPDTYLVEGQNVLAVQAFNRSLTASSDFRFDCTLELDQADHIAPAIAGSTPPAGPVEALARVTVVFTEPVVGVDADDLLINDLPATAIIDSTDAASYTFGFAPLAQGSAKMSWHSDHAITDLAGNPFSAEAPASSWTYDVTDAASPAILELTPAQDSTVSRLTQVEIVFSEPVTGVDASDLTLNGQPAAGVDGRDAGPYRFLVAEPAPGTVRFAWRVDHGITDQSPAANAFTGSGWSLTLDPSLASDTIAIVEFAAANQTGLDDEDGERSDWIEIRNRGAKSVNLLGWSLSDDADVPGRWVFPAVDLAPGGQLVVFASGKDRRLTTGSNRFHTNFKLNPFGEYLALFNAESPRVAVSEFSPSYPEQRLDYSYGVNAAGEWGYYGSPTPGSLNGNSSIAGILPSPHFSARRGLYDAPFNLLLTVPWPNASIRYTTDGSEPTGGTGQLYTAPIPIGRTTVVRAAAFASGQLPSRTRTHSYIFPETVIDQPNDPPGFPTNWGSNSSFPNNRVPADYEMDRDPLRVKPNSPNSPVDPEKLRRLEDGLRKLPTLSVVMNQNDMFGSGGLYPKASSSNKSSNEKACSVEMIEADGTSGFAIEGGLDLHGNASRNPRKNPKHGFKLSFKSDYGESTLNYRLFPDSPVEEFDDLILRPDFNSSWRHWSDSPGNGNGAFQRSRGTRTRYAWSQETFRDMGNVASHSLFFHLFINGLYWGVYDFSEQPTLNFAQSYLGGDSIGYDIYDQGNLREGDSKAYGAMRALGNLANNASYERMKQYLDVPEFIDYMLLHFFVGHQDWGNNKNWYAIRPRAPGAAGTFKYLPWDQECILLEENVNRVPGGGGNTDVPSGLHTKLDDNAQYRLDFADRVHRHIVAPHGALTPEANIVRWRKWQDLLDEAIVAESCRWGDYRRDVHRYSDGTYQLYTREDHWLPENDRLVSSYFVNRGETVLDQLRRARLYPELDAPSFARHGGRVAPGFALRFNAPTAGVYYTTDGTDPRVYGAGTVSPTASLYSSPISLTISATVKARTFRAGEWSALSEATFTVGDPSVPLRITEIMYNPPGGDAYEFIELRNVGGLPLDLGGYRFEGIDYLFPDNTTLLPDGIIVLGSSAAPAAFQARYPSVVSFGSFGKSLDNGGERLAVVDRAGRTVTAVSYDDANGWPVEADGGGYSLELADPYGDLNAPANWRLSPITLGTPGTVPVRPPASVVISEVMAHNLSAVPQGEAFPDWVELHNLGPDAVSLAGWSLSDDGEPGKYRFPEDLSLAPDEHLVVWCGSPMNDEGLHAGFALGRKGETVSLFDEEETRVDAVSFGLQVADLSVGKVDGVWTLTHPTPAQPNAPAELAPQVELTLNEWLADSLPGESDWIELFNRSIELPVALQGLYLGEGDSLFRVGALSFLSPNGYARFFADESPGPDHLDFKLPAGGGTLVFHDATGVQLEQVVYGPQASGVSEGRLPDGGDAIAVFVGSVSPEASNYVLDQAGPVLSEVLARNGKANITPWGGTSDWIEVHNPEATTLDLSGMALTTSAPTPADWVFPSGITLAPGEFLLVWCDESYPASTTLDAPLNTGFSIGGNGGVIELLQASGRRADALRYGYQLPQLSIGRSAGEWRLLSVPTPGGPNAGPAQMGSPRALRINEWMANPTTGDDWFEIHNSHARPLDLGGLYLTDTAALIDPLGTPLEPLDFIAGGGWRRWIADGTSGRANHVGFRLDELGETLRLYGADSTLIDAVDFGLQAADISEGRLPDGADKIVAFATTATPAAANYLPIEAVVVNEVLAHTDPPLEDAIELHNTSDEPVDLGGWYLSDSQHDLKRFRIPDQTVIEPHGFHVFYQEAFGPSAGTEDEPPQFSLNSAHGDAVYLSQTDHDDELTGYRTSVTFSASANGVSMGRYATSQGVDFVALRQRTFGADDPADLQEFRTGTGARNSAPQVGPIVVSEIMYHPASPDASGLEFVELLNLTDAPLPLFDPHFPSHVWQLAGGITFPFASGTTIPGQGRLVVTPFDPGTDATALAAFKTAYPTAVVDLLVGPYSGSLDNGGESIELYRPDTPQSSAHPDAGFVPLLLVDRVQYSNRAPWPAEAGGDGASLHRRMPDAYGNEPRNWIAAQPAPGRAQADLDTDEDGLPDDWETRFGTDPDLPDQLDDPDRDGLTNIEEYRAGTDPLSPASVLALRIQAIESDQVVLQFSAVANRDYSVWYLDSLGRGDWIQLTDVPAADTDRWVTVEDLAPSPSGRFYLLLTPAKP